MYLENYHNRAGIISKWHQQPLVALVLELLLHEK